MNISNFTASSSSQKLGNHFMKSGKESALSALNSTDQAIGQATQYMINKHQIG
jgi:hypothetical protein